jgi:hypothetical protein
MILDTLFNLNKTATVTFYVNVDKEIDGQKTGNVVEAVLFSAKCICVRGAASQKYVSDRMKPDVVATLMIRPRDYAAEVPSGTKAVVEGVGTYSVILPDDVGGQGEAIVIPCKQFT